MDGTISTRAGEGQRAPDGLRSFLAAQGADAVASASAMEDARGRVRLRSAEDIREAGEAFLAAVFGDGWERRLHTSKLDAVMAAPLDPAWLAGRIKQLKPMSDGPMRLIPKLIWDLSTVLSQPDWFDTWMELAVRCPREWLVQFCGVAMMPAPIRRPRGKRSFNRRPDDDLRRLDTRRVQSMLSLGVLAWLLAEYDPSDRRFPYVIRGLPYGAWQHLVAYWVHYADRAYLHVPASTTLFGTHVVGGRWERSECGYIKAWCQAGIAKTHQPNGYAAAPGMAGNWRKNKDGQWERWAILEMRLGVEAPGLAPLVMGPASAPPWRKPPPEPANGELDALVDELERSWYPDEAPTAPNTPATTVQETVAARQDTLHDDATHAVVRCGEDAYVLQEPRTEPPDGGSAETAPEVWRIVDSSSELRAGDDTPSDFDLAARASREVTQWLRTRPRADAEPSAPERVVEPDYSADPDATTLVAASSLVPGAFQAAPSAKFLAALQAYEAEKLRRERERAQKKRKPPS